MDFLAELTDQMAPGDWLLLGTDLVKDPARLVAAYDDAAGVTAAFDLNILAHLNHSHAATFDLGAFTHRAVHAHDLRTFGDLDAHRVAAVEHRQRAGGDVREMIVATGTTMEGEATAHYLRQLALRANVRATRIAYGVPVGGDLEFVDGSTLSHALASRRDY